MICVFVDLLNDCRVADEIVYMSQSAGGCGATSGPRGGRGLAADRLGPLGSWMGGSGAPSPPSPSPTLLFVLLLALPPILHTAGNLQFAYAVVLKG